jgi:hypothetical protein
VGPRTGLDVMTKSTIPVPTGNITPVVQPVASHFTVGAASNSQRTSFDIVSHSFPIL